MTWEPGRDRVQRKFDPKPHLTDGFKLSTDPLFVEKVVDVVDLYHNPPEKAGVRSGHHRALQPGPRR